MVYFSTTLLFLADTQMDVKKVLSNVLSKETAQIYFLATNILNRLVEKYYGCSSYQDGGRVFSKVFSVTRVVEDSTIVFNNLFIRPQILRFEFSGSKVKAKNILIVD